MEGGRVHEQQAGMDICKAEQGTGILKDVHGCEKERAVARSGVSRKGN